MPNKYRPDLLPDILAEDLDILFDKGEDISQYMDDDHTERLDGTPLSPQ